MKITKKRFNVNTLYDVELKYNIHINNLNVYTLCHYINYKTYMLNKLRKNLLFTKIEILRNSKNFLLRMLYHYKNLNDKYQKLEIYKILEVLRNEYKREYNFLINNNLLVITANDLKNHSEFFDRNRYIENLKYSIKRIDRAIKKYKKEMKSNKPYFKYKINSYDLYMLKNRKLTSNIQKVIYYYLIKLKKSKISNKTLKYLSSPLVKNLINSYTSNLSLISKDFYDILKNELKSYEYKFLYKEL